MTTTTRRAALGALASVPALALPAVAIATPADTAMQDAELFRLIQAAREAGSRCLAADEACDEAMLRTVDVPPPQALITREDDFRLALGGKVGEPIWEDHIKLLRDLRELHRLRGTPEALGQAAVTAAALPQQPIITPAVLREMAAAWAARTDELIEASEQWKAAKEQAMATSGEVAAEKLRDERVAEERKLLNMIVMTPAQTTAGMMAKLAFAAPYYNADNLGGWENQMDQILASVAMDFKTLETAGAV